MTGASGDPLLISCLGVQDDLALLPHFLAHYRDLGIKAGAAHVILHAPEASYPGVAEARETLAAFGHEAAEIWTDPYSSGAMWERRRALQERVAGPRDWIVNADVDEFHEYPAPLAEVQDWCASLNITCVQGPFIDRIAPDGTLAPVRAAPSLDAQFPIKAEAMLQIAGTDGAHDQYGTVKLMLHRADVQPSRGGHHPRADRGEIRYALRRPLAEFQEITYPPFRFSHPFRVHHYKWTDTLITGMQRRLAGPGLSPAGRDYGTRLLEYFAAHDGFDLNDLALYDGEDSPGRPWRAQMAALRRRSQIRSVMGKVKRRLKRVVQ